MEVRYHCPKDNCVAIIEYAPLEECGATIECPRCHESQAITVSDSVRDGGTVDACAVCGGSEMFVRKDFPQALGLAIVIVFGLVAIYFFRISVVKAWAVLASALVLDLLIYFVVGKVTTCYACRAEYRGCGTHPGHEAYDLATSEKY